jgi:starvation-inducible DNA-binding protein
MNLNAIGLDVGKAENLSAKLNQLLANYQVFYINVRGFHWNIKGDKFFELHIKFEELYNDLQLKNDEIAERILTLGNTPFHSYTDYLMNSKVKEVTDISDGNQSVAEILNAFKVIIKLQREILSDSDEAGDEGTNALMSDYIREQEKLVWMYSSFLGDKILS